MLRKFKSFYNKSEKKKLISNFFSLSVLQLFSYILPLLTIPYLIRVLGDELFGIVVLAQTTIIFFNTFIDFGFDLSATRDISVNREDKSKIIEIFSSVLILKSALYVISFLALLIMLNYAEFTSNYKLLYLITFIPSIGHVFFPIWYFQGLEEMKYITIINILSRVIFTILIFVFVNNENDYLLVPILNGLGLVFCGVYSMKIIREKFDQRFKLQSLNTLKFYLKDSFQFFLSRLSSVGYTNLNTLVIGIIMSPVYVTYYHLANRIISVVLNLFNPVVQSIYPYLSKAFNFKFLLKITGITMFFSFLVSVILYLFADFISIFLLKEVNELFIKIYSILLFLIPISVLYVMIGAPLLLARGFKKEFNLSIVFGFLIHVVAIYLIYLFTMYYQTTDTEVLIKFAKLLVLTKLVVLVLRMYYVKINNLYKRI